MTFAAHLSKLNESSLEARVNNFRVAFAAYRDIQTSQSVHKQTDMQDTLGTTDELNQANNIIKNSLDIAVKNFSKSDLQKAQQQGLLSDFETKNIDAISMGKDLTSSNEQDIQENKDRIAQARVAMSDKKKDKSKDKSRDR